MPNALAFSRSMSSLNVGVSSRPFGRTCASIGSFSRRSEQLVARLHELLVAEAAAIFELQIEAGGVAERGIAGGLIGER